MCQFYDDIQQVGRRDVCNTGQNLAGSHGDPRRTEASWREKRWHRPKLPHCPLDTLCGKAPKVRRLCWWKIVGKSEAQGHKTVKPSPPGSRCFGTMPEDLSKFFEPMLDPLLAVERSLAAQAGPPDAATHAVIPTSYGGVDEVGTRDRQGWISWDDAPSLTTLGPIGNPAPVSIVRRAPCTESPSLVSSHRRCTKPSPSLSRSTEERRGHETFRLFDRARNLTPGLRPSSLAV